MSRKGGSKTDAAETSVSKEMPVKDLSAAFISKLDNDEVIATLASILSTSINLILDENLTSLVTKLDIISTDIQAVNARIQAIEHENTKLKQLHDGLRATVDGLAAKVNLLEQASRKCSLIISGVPETYAEWAVDAPSDDGADPPVITREDTIKTVIDVHKVACNVTVTATNLQSATRLYSKRTGPRPLLVTFYSLALLNSVVKARRLKQTLQYKNALTFINDHLTKLNTDLSFKARQLVKQEDAYSTYVRDGRIYILMFTGLTTCAGGQHV